MEQNVMPNLPVMGLNHEEAHRYESDQYGGILTKLEYPKRKRGRPFKYPQSFQNRVMELGGLQIKKGPRGRPRKYTYTTEDGQVHTVPSKKKKTTADLICELGRLFYNLGWVSGTGGGISIRDGDHIFVAPSGVQKERLEPQDLFIIDKEGKHLHGPHPDTGLKLSQCTPLFLLAYNMRGAGAVIHSHSKQAVLATLAYPGPEFKVTHLEMIKGIYNPVEKRSMRYDEDLVVPIIENTSFESDLADSMAEAIQHYPYTNAVLVRRHGLYVWGETWEKAKTMAECYDYLFDVATQMTRFNLDPTKVPDDKHGAFEN
ncbi:UNVERIFIED_CONTAM: hypothetical protein RMT77_007594 [Armadillidium vulgare]